LVVLKSSFRWRWPMIAMYPFVSHCTIWPSWVKEFVSYYWWFCGLEFLHTLLFKLSLCAVFLTVAPMSLTIFLVTCSSCWNLNVLTPTL
jgi:hypothetical protein